MLQTSNNVPNLNENTEHQFQQREPKLYKRFQKTQAECYLDVELQAHQERLRQIRQTFNVYIVAIRASALISIAGVVLMFSGKAMEGAIGAVTGSGAVAFFSKVARSSSRESSKNLDKLVKEVNTLRQTPNN